jgi:type II secretory pathway component PulF
MPTFSYHAIDPRGTRLAGRADAPTASALWQALEDRGLVVLEVRAGSDHPSVRVVEGFRRSLRGPLVDVTRALAGLMAAGLSLTRALAAANAVSGGTVGERLTLVRDRVSRGDTLATALAAHPDVFPPLYVGLIRAGERSGDLAGTFTRLATQLEREDELRSKLVSAAIYPVLLAVVGTTAVLVLLLFVLPRFAGVLEGAGAHIPRSTQLLISASAAAQHYWFLFLIPPVAIVSATMWVQSSVSGARAWASILVTLPLIGRLRRDILASRFARTMSVLLTGGAPVLRALDDASASLDDLLARDEVARVRARVREGASIHLALEDSTLFPPLLAQLVALGEETGKLEEFLRKAADLFEQRTERSTSRLVALAEPAMIVVLGIVVGSVALSLLQAIYGLNAGSFG